MRSLASDSLITTLWSREDFAKACMASGDDVFDNVITCKDIFKHIKADAGFRET
jgi:hypothetical protein